MFAYRIDDDLELRLLEERHAEVHFALVERNREYLQQWLGLLPRAKSVEEAREFIRMSLEAFAKGEDLPAGIWYRGQYAGGVSLNRIDKRDRLSDVGYWVSEDLQGRGIVTRCCKAILDYAFDELGLNRIEIFAAVANTKSRAIPERLGFVLEGVLRQAQFRNDSYIDMALYSMLASEWKSLSK